MSNLFTSYFVLEECCKPFCNPASQNIFEVEVEMIILVACPKSLGVPNTREMTRNKFDRIYSFF